MRLGINTFLFTSPFTNDSTKLFKQFKQWGFDTIEIPIEDPSHIDPAAREARAGQARAGLRLGLRLPGTGPRSARHA